MKTFILSLCLLSSTTFARPQYFNMLLVEYPGSRISTTFKCQACHNGRAMNLYGQAFVNEFSSSLTKPQIFKKIGPFDSDGDEISNSDEIMLGQNPGVAGK